MDNDFEERDNYKDVVDLLVTGSKGTEWVQTPEGVVRQESIEYDSIYWSTRNINSNKFGRFVQKLKVLEGLANEAVYNMEVARSNVLVSQIKNIVSSYKRSIDAKNSETVIDKNHAQSNLLDKLLHRKSEKTLNIKDQTKKGLGSAFLARESERETE